MLISDAKFKVIKTYQRAGVSTKETAKNLELKESTIKAAYESKSVEEMQLRVMESMRAKKQKPQEETAESSESTRVLFDVWMDTISKMLYEIITHQKETLDLLKEIKSKDMKITTNYSPYMMQEEKKKMELIEVMNNKLGVLIDQWVK